VCRHGTGQTWDDEVAKGGANAGPRAEGPEQQHGSRCVIDVSTRPRPRRYPGSVAEIPHARPQMPCSWNDAPCSRDGRSRSRTGRQVELIPALGNRIGMVRVSERGSREAVPFSLPGGSFAPSLAVCVRGCDGGVSRGVLSKGGRAGGTIGLAMPITGPQRCQARLPHE